MTRLITVLAGVAVAAATFIGGYAIHAPHGPARCWVLNGDQGPETGTAQQSTGTAASGDAIRGPGGIEFVCTDGRWVHVTGYGTPA